MNETTLKQVASYVPEALYDKVAADAKANKRSISAQLHLILEQHYERALVRRLSEPAPTGGSK